MYFQEREMLKTVPELITDARAGLRCIDAATALREMKENSGTKGGILTQLLLGRFHRFRDIPDTSLSVVNRAKSFSF
jgi:hypothetical protein